MTLRRLLPLLGGQRGQALVRPGQLIAPLTLTRAQAGGARSTALGADGTTWAEYAADVPRFNGSPRRLLIGGQRTNGVRNPRAAGAVVGSPGTLPTHWSGATGAFTRTVVETGTEAGFSYVDLRFVGASGQNVFLNFEGVIAATVAQVWSIGVFARLVAGSMTNLAPNWTVFERNAALSIVATAGTAGFSIGAAATRPTISVTISDATTAWLDAQFRLIATGAYDATIRVYAPQSEMGAFASSPILPAVGSPAASTRGADLVTAALSALGIGGNGACTILWKGMLPQAAPAAASQNVIQVDDGTDANRYVLRNSAGTSAISLFRFAASASSTASAGVMVAGTPFAVGMTMDGAGRVAASLNGATAVAVTGGPTSGLSTLRVGISAAGQQPMFGEVDTLMVLPFTLSDADLAARVAAL